MASKEDLYKNPLHPYTQALLAAIPKPDPNKKSDIGNIKGEIPSNVNLPKGCPFHTRCPYAKDICREKVPETGKWKKVILLPAISLEKYNKREICVKRLAEMLKKRNEILKSKKS